MKPIEPGCLAIIVGANYHTECIGKCATVIKRCDSPMVMRGSEVVEAMGVRWVVKAIGEEFSCEERYLLRIDDYDASTEENTSDREATV